MPLSWAAGAALSTWRRGPGMASGAALRLTVTAKSPAIPVPSQLPALGRELNGHSHRMFCSLHLAMSTYGSNHEQR